MASNPAFLFLLVWSVPLAAPYFIQTNIIQEISSTTQYLVLSNIVVFFILIISAKLMLGGCKRNLAQIIFCQINYSRLEKKTLNLFKIWLVIFFINIIFSGGIPIYWVLSGDPRTYADFGLPTLGGLGNMFRAFTLSACYLIYFHTKSENKKLFLCIGLFLLVSSFILETGRGTGLVLLLHPIAFYLILNRSTLFKVLKSIILFILLLFFLGYIQVIRYGGDFENLVVFAENAGFSDNDGMSLLLIPSFLYVVVPIINVDLNIIASPMLKFDPYYVFQGFVPTALRSKIFSADKDYGVLVNESHNVSSFYIPFVRDFGVVGAFIAVTLIQIIVCYVFVKACRGTLFHFFLWPPLFMSVILSVFSLFFTSLVVLAYPFLVLYFVNGIRIRENRCRTVIMS